jgi:type I restriction enzyme, S subunit
MPTDHVALLGKIEVLSGYAFPSSRFSTETGIPLVRIRDLGRDRTEALYAGAFDARFLVRPGDVLVGMDGDFIAVRWRGNEALLNQRVCRVSVTPGGRLDLGYVFHWLQPKLDEIRNRTGATTVCHLSASGLEAVTLPALPLSEQRRIAEILDALDEAIRKTEQIIAKLKQVKKGLLQDLLTRGIDENRELRDPARHPEQFKRDPELGLLPSAWAVNRFADLCESSAFGPRFPSDRYSNDGPVATLRTTDMDDEGSIDLTTMPRADIDPQKFAQHLLRCEDLVISRHRGRVSGLPTAGRTRSVPHSVSNEGGRDSAPLPQVLQLEPWKAPP